MSAFLLLALLTGASETPSASKPDIYAEARCVLRDDPVRAKAFASSEPYSVGERAALEALSHVLTICAVEIKAATTANLLAGAIAEKIKRDSDTLVMTLSYRGFEPKKMDAAGVSERALSKTANWPQTASAVDCAAFRDPKSADMILKATPGSTRELKAFARIIPAIQRCVDNGKAVAFDRGEARAIIARAHLR